MNARRPLAIASLAALLVAALGLVRELEPSPQNSVSGERARAGIEREGDIPLPLNESGSSSDRARG